MTALCYEHQNLVREIRRRGLRVMFQQLLLPILVDSVVWLSLFLFMSLCSFISLFFFMSLTSRH